MSDKLPVFKDGECPYCHHETHAIGDEPLQCEFCGWIDMEPKTHEIKIWEDPFIAAHIGIKPWEYRKDDRCYNVGDVLCLNLWDEEINDYVGIGIKRRVTYILRGPAYGIPEGYCIMTTEVINKEISMRDCIYCKNFLECGKTLFDGTRKCDQYNPI